jgi:alpha-tubulin suppressor-like RCC1 family protein
MSKVTLNFFISAFFMFSIGCTLIVDSGTDTPNPELVADNTSEKLVSTKLASGNDFNCAITDLNSVLCWGKSNNLRLGNSSSASLSHSTAVTVENLAGVKPLAIATGRYHGCVIDNNYEVYCWGRGLNGQLGADTLPKSQLATKIQGLNGIVQIDAGNETTCAVRSDGTLWCWGSNEFGQLGQGVASLEKCDSLIECSSHPLKVQGLSGITQVSVGENHVCALNSSGESFCWGNNLDLQIGGQQKTQTTPLLINITHKFSMISAARFHTCGLSREGEVYCWGSAIFGRLGNGSTDSFRTAIPQKVAGLHGRVLSLQTHERHSCVILETHRVQCWGWNAFGQIGIGQDFGPNTCLVSGVQNEPCAPQATDTFSLNGEVHDLSLGATHSCARLKDGTIQCWGNNLDGQLGLDLLSSSVLPISPLGL